MEEEREFLLRSLRDLDAEYAAGDLAAGDYERLRDEYTVRAAHALRAQEAPAPGASRARRPRLVRSTVAAASVAVLAGLAGYAVAETAGDRRTGEQVSGSLPEGSVDRIIRAQALVAEGKVLDAIKLYDALLEDDPENPVALAQRGWLISRVDASLVDSGLAGIDRAIAVDPTYPEAHFFRGMILWQAKGDARAAVASFQRALDVDPPPDLVAVLERVRGQAAEAAAAQP